MARSKLEVCLRATEASKFLNLTIDEFLRLIEIDGFPKRIDFGVGKRWSKQELREWKNENSNRNK